MQHKSQQRPVILFLLAVADSDVYVFIVAVVVAILHNPFRTAKGRQGAA